MKIHIGRLELAALIGLVITLGVSSVTGFMQDCAELRQEVLRIHILADSDREADQAVKLQVRDAVLEAINQDFSGDGTLEGTLPVWKGRWAALRKQPTKSWQRRACPIRPRRS